MEVKKIKTTNSDGKITEIEVSFDIWQFEESCKWKEEYQKRKTKGNKSYDEMCRLYEKVYKRGTPPTFMTNSSEDEYITKFQKERLYEAIEQLPEKQKERIILRFFYDLKISEIAKIENRKERVIYMGISDSLRFLKRNLEKNNN